MTQTRQSKDMEDQIRQNLQRAFREKAEEQVPDRFLALLDQLRRQDEDGDDAK